ncbi:MAG: M20 family metallopeptidase [Gemmatimonadetes bacterium]|nr:M20 family metallopeptidase [Gemmatimonadota bacterium]MDA1102167.1 M20 family metallopeptidase [Gemmatimonadota bacterium]
MSDGRAPEVLALLRGHTEEMVALLVELATLESPTDVPETQRPVQARLREVLEARGFRVRHLPGVRTGGHLYARPASRVHGRPGQLLIGHSDTVWPLGTLASMPVLVENGHIRGPGTFDMKAGLVQGLFALRALQELGLEPPATPIWFINSDEEIGSPESKRWVRLIAKRVARTFVLEPSLGTDGRLKTARKGIARYVVAVSGVAAHAGLDPTGGASAIQELSHVIQQLHGLTDLDRGTTVNVGLVQGGTRPNVVAADASATVDVRMMTVADGREVHDAIHALVPKTPRTRISVTGGIEVPPLELTERNRGLWRAAVEAAERLGLPLDEATAGGGSDGNTTSQYTATLDGLGPIGDGAHAAYEHVVVSSMADRSALLAELLMAPLRPGG